MINKNRKGIYRFNNIIIIFFSLFLIIFTIIQYINAKNNEIDSINESIDLLIPSLEDRLTTIDKLYYSLELSVEDSLHETAESMNTAYNNNTLSNEYISLLASSDEFLDVYVIDENNIISMTTYISDLNFDLSFSPYLADYLNNIRINGEYVSDRVSISALTTDIKKYVYYPSDDGKYIFEVSYNMEKFSEILSADDLETFTSSAVNKNINILSIDVYDRYGNSMGSQGETIESIYNDEKMLNAYDEAHVDNIITQNITDEGYYTETTIFVPFEISAEKNIASEFVISINYTTKYAIDEINQNFIFDILIIICFLILISIINIYNNRHYHVPLNNLLTGLELVRQKNLDIRLPIKGNKDIKKASESFNDMVSNIQKVLSEQEKSYLDTVKALANSIDAKDQYTGGHCERVMELSILLGKHLSLEDDDIKTITYGSLLHDIGKIGIKDSILNKQSKFTAEEYEIIKKHPEIGYNILSDIEFLSNANEMILFHHERIDGKGYPKGLSGTHIPYLARILSIIDAFDAMTSQRNYRPTIMTAQEGLDELKRCSGTQFDTELVIKFTEAYINEFGTELNDDANVIEKHHL
jgi:HD-GYP domain-containing protein (c-di-GMP phosphodiesterase class II)